MDPPLSTLLGKLRHYHILRIRPMEVLLLWRNEINRIWRTERVAKLRAAPPEAPAGCTQPLAQGSLAAGLRHLRQVHTVFLRTFAGPFRATSPALIGNRIVVLSLVSWKVSRPALATMHVPPRFSQNRWGLHPAGSIADAHRRASARLGFR